MNALITVISDIATDRRVLKHAALLNEMSFNVTIVGRKLDDSPEIPDSHIKYVRFGMVFTKGPLMYLSFNLRLFFYLILRKTDLYLANDLDTLLPCYIASSLFHRPLLYDSHEYFTGQHGLAERKLKYNIWKKLERFLLPRIKWMLTVNKSVASLYREEYGIKPTVVRNIATSSMRIAPRQRSEIGIGDNELLLVVEGLFPRSGRGVEELLKAMKNIDNVKLLFIGSGDNVSHLKELAASDKTADKVIFLPRMKWEEMMSYIKSCDVGISLDKDTCTNQFYSLPNKLFDYISAGIPVIASPLPEISEIINDYGCGIILEDLLPSTIAGTIMTLRDDRFLLSELKLKTLTASSDLSWEKEKLIEQNIIESVINTELKNRK